MDLVIEDLIKSEQLNLLPKVILSELATVKDLRVQSLFGFAHSQQVEGNLAQFMNELNARMLDDSRLRILCQIRMKNQGLYQQLSRLQAKMSKYHFQLAVIYLKSYLEDYCEQCYAFLQCEPVSDLKWICENHDLMQPFYEIETSDIIFVNKIG